MRLEMVLGLRGSLGFAQLLRLARQGSGTVLLPLIVIAPGDGWHNNLLGSFGVRDSMLGLHPVNISSAAIRRTMLCGRSARSLS